MYVHARSVMDTVSPENLNFYQRRPSTGKGTIPLCVSEKYGIPNVAV